VRTRGHCPKSEKKRKSEKSCILEKIGEGKKNGGLSWWLKEGHGQGGGGNTSFFGRDKTQVPGKENCPSGPNNKRSPQKDTPPRGEMRTLGKVWDYRETEGIKNQGCRGGKGGTMGRWKGGFGCRTFKWVIFVRKKKKNPGKFLCGGYGQQGGLPCKDFPGIQKKKCSGKRKGENLWGGLVGAGIKIVASRWGKEAVVAEGKRSVVAGVEQSMGEGKNGYGG